jgi:hypothetical protein
MEPRLNTLDAVEMPINPRETIVHRKLERCTGCTLVIESKALGLPSKQKSNPASSRVRRVGGGAFVQVDSVEKARWLRDLQRFLSLRSQFVLSGNTRDLQIHEPAPGAITAVPLARVLPDALKDAGYQRIASFDMLSGQGKCSLPQGERHARKQKDRPKAF